MSLINSQIVTTVGTQLRHHVDKPNLLNFSRQGLEEYFESIGEKRFRANQVFKWMYQHGVNDFACMTNIGKQLRIRLEQTVQIRLPKIVLDQRSEDGTHKWVLELDSGNHIETVFIPEKNISVTITVCANPPRKLPTIFPANRTSLSVNFARFIISPLIIKKGIANKTMSSIVVNILCGIIKNSMGSVILHA